MAIEFDGTNFIEIPDVAAHRTTPLTVCFWTKCTALPEEGTNYQPIGKYGVLTGHENWNFRIQEGGAFHPTAVSTEYFEDIGFNAGPFPTGVWRHVGMYFESAAVGHKLRAVINGTAVGGQGDSGTMAGSCTLRIGGRGDEGDPIYDGYRGLIEDVRIYNRRLNVGEFIAIYGSGTPGGIEVDAVTSGLIGHWKLQGEGTATGEGSILDSSGGNYHGTPFDDPVYVEGIIPAAESDVDTLMKTWVGIGLNLIKKQGANG